MMLKYLAILVIVWFAIEAMPAHNQVSSKRTAGQSQQSAQQPSAPAVAPATINQATNYYQQDPADKPQGWHKFVTWPDGIVAWLIMLTLVAIVWQAWETRKAAEATSRGLEIGKTKERAKIVLVVSNLNPLLNTIPKVQFTVANKGESKAFIHAAIGALHISKSKVLVGNGSGWYLLKAHDSVMPSDHSSTEEAVWPGHPLDVYTQEMIDGNSKDWFIHLHGKIAFRDAFEDSWELKFHYIWRELGGMLYLPPLGNTTGYWESQLSISEEKVKKKNRLERLRATIWAKLPFRKKS